MKEDFILKVIEKFEKGDTVVLQIKQDDCELILKKEGAFPKKEAAIQSGACGGVQTAYPMTYPDSSGRNNRASGSTSSSKSCCRISCSSLTRSFIG